MDTTRERWIARNPLVAWRLSQSPPWSSYQLARELGFSLQAVRYWETGRRRPTLDTFQVIKLLTGITAEEWCAWLSEEPKNGRRLEAVPP